MRYDMKMLALGAILAGAGALGGCAGEPTRAAAEQARVTGQWGGSLDGLRWRRSVADATGQGRPILVLHLFGELDKEFC
jgi:hypothetical protein